MFCLQCEQTAGGKNSATALLQDKLAGALAKATVESRKDSLGTKRTHWSELYIKGLTISLRGN
ncbi:hypothetical protein FACS1894200_03590 [Spirochaetia bacterium]|nr:hypothetical protein FACS1894200_03590 [Spirochaetia bacterium]